jgi:Ca2+-transporting ATPase
MSDMQQPKYYRIDAEEALRQTHSSKEGLPSAEAAARLSQYGGNALDVARKEPPLFTYLRQFKDLMILLLLASSIISYFLEDARTAVVLLAIVFFNTTIGFLQEFKAEKVLESLAKMAVTSAVVIRGGKKHLVPSSDLVVGDIVYIEEGNAVPADMRVIEEHELSTNDFALTGESNPSRKFAHSINADVPLADRHNLVFMGTTVATGHALGVVTATAMHTELGRIANLSQGVAGEASPLQKEMNNVATRVTIGTMVLCVILLPIAIAAGLVIKDAFLVAIGIAASLVPQGLPAEINTALAQAANKLAKARALIKRLSAVEGLGATSVICTDKTGTLTKNQMTVEQFLIGTTTYGVTGRGYEPKGAIVDDKDDPLTKTDLEKLELFLVTGALASNARLSPPDDQHPTWYCLGDPTEGAVVNLAMKAGFEPDGFAHKYPELTEFSFDSGRKRMSSVRHYRDGEGLYVFTKGAPESVLGRCEQIWDHGKIRKLTKKDREYILKTNDHLASQAMRNLGFAYRVLPKDIDHKKLAMDMAESELVWLGMASLIDPLREHVPNAMEAARRAHIKVCIVTGDHAITARAIAVRAKLAEKAEDIVVVSGDELKKLSGKKVLSLAARGGVIFSRVTPEDKLRIVSLLQKSGRVVAVTGDGINDAPALKRADIGVAMGLTGTDIAKQSADVVLLDDSFNTLVGTVQEGRVIYQNIHKGALSAFTGNASELIVMLVSLGAATIYNIPLAISVIQILAIDLIAEFFPVAALGQDKADGELMNERPRDPKRHILNVRSVLDLLWCGLLIGGLSFANYLLFFDRNGVVAQYLTPETPIHMQATALTYLTMVLCLLLNVLHRRSSGGLFTRYQFHNKQFWWAMALSMFCVLNIIYNPWVAPYFKSGPLGLVDWLYALGAAAVFILIREFQRHNRKHHRKAVLELHRTVHARKM